MPISWNEIRHNAIRFTKEWAGETREEAEAKSFWDDFFQVFGLRRRTVATFEEPVKNIAGDYGYIDLFWRGGLMVPVFGDLLLFFMLLFLPTSSLQKVADELTSGLAHSSASSGLPPVSAA